MFLLFPAISLIIVAAWVCRLSDKIRYSFIISFIIHASFILLTSEVLSLAEQLTSKSIIIAWISAPLICLVLLGRRIPTLLAGLFKSIKQQYHRLCRADLILISASGSLILITLIVAVFATPNNHDSLTYHLPRILMWLQNHSLTHYSCEDFRLLYNPPLAELIQAHLWILSDGCLPSMNLAQWISYIVIALSASLMTQALGAPSRLQILSAITALTLPSSVLESTTTQNDLVMGAFLFAGLALLLQAFKHHFSTYWTVGLLSLSLALATKATAFFFIPFLMLWPALQAIKLRKFLQILLIPAIIVPSAGWLTRNHSYFGNPLGYHDQPSMEKKINFYKNETLTPAALISSTAKNLSLFLATPLSSLNSKVETTVRLLSSITKIDADDSRLTWYYQKFHVPGTGPHEDAPPVFWHFLIACALFSQTLIKDISNRKISTSTLLSLIMLAGMAATAGYVKWMPWNIRFLALWLIPLIAVNITTHSSLRSQVSGFTPEAEPLLADKSQGSLPFPFSRLSRFFVFNNSLSQSRNKAIPQFILHTATPSDMLSDGSRNSLMLYALCSLLLFSALPFAAFSMRRSLMTFDLPIGSRQLHFVSVFEDDTAYKLTLDKQKARDLKELAGFVAQHTPSEVAILRHGIDPAIFPAMYLIRQSLPSVLYHSTSISILKSGKNQPDFVVSIDVPAQFLSNHYRHIFSNSQGSVYVLSNQATP